MPTDDTTIKTSVRLPKSLHAQLEHAAHAGGLTVNGEMVFRMQHDPRAEHASALIEMINERDAATIDHLRKQVKILWSALDRADGVLGQVAGAMTHVSPESQLAELKREVEYARQLIDTLGIARPDSDQNGR
ncbi:hypothetical protein [Paraburkholderia sp. 22B1P]|uniref:hypothetical protein n=1 Tax=Paraburkholderia sp. 22B1P TaxID=3080498 RepID=UPI0030878310|nr:toxin-antitoxin system HicB family antitoxin [Paraburkholderia sp. 22B1P]